MADSKEIDKSNPEGNYSYRFFIKSLTFMGIPIMLSALTEPVLTMTDTFVAGQLGKEQLGAMGLAGSLHGALVWLFFFLTAWTTTSVGKAFGRKDMRAANRATIHGLQIAIGCGVALGLILFLGADLIIYLTGAVDELVDPAVSYLRWRSLGMPFLMISMVFWGAYRGVNQNMPVLYISTFIAILNLPVSIGLALGMGWGLTGVAFGTDIVEIVEAGLLTFFAWKKLGVRLPKKGRRLASWLEFRAMLASVSNLFVRSVFLSGQFIVLGAVAGRMGVIAAAAHQILLQVRTTQSVAIDAFATAAQSLIAQSDGEGNIEKRQKLMKAALATGAGFGLILIPILYFARYPLIELFTDDQGVIELASVVWLVPVLGAVIDGLTFVGDGIVMGRERWKVLTISAVLGASQTIAIAVAAVYFNWSLFWMWVGIPIAIAIRGVALWVGMDIAHKKDVREGKEV